MTPNNRCRYLIVYGSYAPGGANHHIFNDVPGTWRRGFASARMVRPPDGIQGDSGEVDAWLFSFAGMDAELFSPERKEQDRRLHELWEQLDERMGPRFVRDSRGWHAAEPSGVTDQPADEGRSPRESDRIVVNIYLLRDLHPELGDQDDVVHPDDRNDVGKLWRQVVSGEKRYDWSHFQFLLVEPPASYEALFGDLPQGLEFVERVRRVESVRREWGGPYATSAWPPDQLMAAAAADLEQRALILESYNELEHAATLRQCQVVAGTSASYDPDCPAAEAWEFSGELLLNPKKSAYWQYCLSEACYGFTGNNLDVRHWMMTPWIKQPVDLEPMFDLWRGGGTYGFAGDRVHVFSRVDST